MGVSLINVSNENEPDCEQSNDVDMIDPEEMDAEFPFEQSDDIEMDFKSCEQDLFVFQIIFVGLRGNQLLIYFVQIRANY